LSDAHAPPSSDAPALLDAIGDPAAHVVIERCNPGDLIEFIELQTGTCAAAIDPEPVIKMPASTAANDLLEKNVADFMSANPRCQR
jgi:hypothetical protein